MPGYRVHLIGASVMYLGIIYLMQSAHLSASTLFQGFIFCLIGSLFPDIDIKSKGQKLFYILLLIILIMLAMQQKYCMFAIMSFLGIIPILVKHRGIFHHIWFLMAIACAFSLFVKSFCGWYEGIMLNNVWFFFTGALSHILLDRITTKLKQSF